MNLSHVHAFVRVVEARSFTQAARALDLPTSSVSRAISRLEAELGAKLFERTTRRLALTSLGRAYYEHAARALAELSEGERRVGELQRDPRGEVRVTAPADLDDGFFARCLADFTKVHPRIRVTCVLSNNYVDLIAERFDLAMRIAESLPDSSLVARQLGRYRAWLVASPEYLARRGHPKRPGDLADHDCVLNVPRDGASTWVLIGPRGEQSVEVRGRLAADDLRFARDLVVAGAGIGVLPLAPGASEPVDERLVRVLPQYTMRAPSLFAVVPSAKRLASRVSLLRDHLVNAYASTV
ncbi:MAG: LysR family transcriptional regulator [Polyangiaceae bacterium]|nr:LysR family transcriptional regulator [Polyangiaceae bacterium]